MQKKVLEHQLQDKYIDKAMEEDPCITDREYASEIGTSPTTVSRHLKLIGKTKKLDSWVPHELNERQLLHFINFL